MYGKTQLCANLRACGEDLCKGKLRDELSARGKLRVLQEEIQHFISMSDEPQIRAIAFLLSVWIDRYYFNLSADFPSEISESVTGIRHRLLIDKVGPILRDLSDALLRNGESLFACVTSLLVAYLDAVGSVSKLVEEVQK